MFNYLYIVFTSCVLFFGTLIFIVWSTWGSAVDLSLIISNAHMIKHVKISYYWKEILLACTIFLSMEYMSIRYKKIGIIIALVMICYIFYFCSLSLDTHDIADENFYQNNFTIPKVIRGKKRKNIIYISLESTTSLWTYSNVINTKEVLIPNLLEMKDRNISFNGWHSGFGMSPTIPSFTAANCGVTNPGVSYDMLKYYWKTNAKINSIPNAVCVSDFLKKERYRTFYIMGGNIGEEKADNMVRNHSFDYIYGNKELRKMGYTERGAAGYLIPDSLLLKFAKELLLKIPEKQYFFMSIILGNTHGPDFGYTESFCDEHYAGDIRDAYRCMDKIIFDFINWCKKQTFFKDTVIFLVGDHKAWDKQLKKNRLNYDALKEYPSEETYNVVIDGEGSPKRIIFRNFSQVDFAPTILESAGFILLPRRLGLGVSLWSDDQTLVQKLGVQNFNKKIKQDPSYFKILYGEEIFKGK